jgi:hypothetical protein
MAKKVVLFAIDGLLEMQRRLYCVVEKSRQPKK